MTDRALTVFMAIGYQLWRGARHWAGITVAEELARRGHRVSVFLPHQNPLPSGDPLAFLPPLGVELRYSGRLTSATSRGLHGLGSSPSASLVRWAVGRSRALVRRYAGDRLAYPLFRRSLKQASDSGLPDVLHAFGPSRRNWAAMLWGREHGVPIVYTETGEPPGSWRVAAIRLERLLSDIAAVTVPGPGLLDAFRESGYQGKAEVIPFGIPDPLRGEAQPEQPDRASSGEARLVVGCSSRLDPFKGLETLVAAFAPIARARPDVRLRIAGEGSHRPAIEELLAEEHLTGRVELVGAYDLEHGLHTFMESLDVFVLPSLSEGQPISIIEAMAFAKPVVATAVGSVPTLIEGAGICVPPCDAEALREALAKVIEEPGLRARMARDTRARYLAGHRIEALAERYVELYTGVSAVRGSARRPRPQARGV